MAYSERVLILTPAKDAARYVGTYLRGLYSLTYPRHLLSLAVLEGDSTDGTYELFARHLPELNGVLRSAELHLSAAKRLILLTWGDLINRKYPQQPLQPLNVPCD
jgi:cellulose synthase/poly-beta-1,6-N-acetylglucosamine synthase-like glycosyltransferase